MPEIDFTNRAETEVRMKKLHDSKKRLDAFKARMAELKSNQSQRSARKTSPRSPDKPTPIRKLITEQTNPVESL
jgi:hypothetical protein